MTLQTSNLALWHWHIEISSKCTLKCPRCARSEVPDTLINTELSLEFFKRNFTPSFITENVEKITFCGDDGDPIYAKSLIDVITYFKSIKPVSFVIVTNGSHKSTEWWMQLGKVLTDIDHVHFSIDGYDNSSNNQYRVNSDWDSIINGITTLRSVSQTFITWATIGFSFNQRKISDMMDYAASIGCDYFQLTRSTKFGKVYPTYLTNGSDVLQPMDGLISNIARFTRDIIPLSDRELKSNDSTASKLFQSTKTVNDVTPICHVGGKGLYISSLGKFYPCCWVANRYAHNSEWKDLAFDLHTTTLEEALNDSFWSNDFMTFRWTECKSKCSAANVTYKYASEW